MEDPDQEFASPADAPEPAHSSGPRIINVGLGIGRDAARWRRAWRDKILPALLNFGPDLILVSAGFDAHRHDDINMRYIGLQERDFEWVTDQIVQVSRRFTNICGSCHGWLQYYKSLKAVGATWNHPFCSDCGGCCMPK